MFNISQPSLNGPVQTPYPGPQSLGTEMPNEDPSDHVAIASNQLRFCLEMIILIRQPSLNGPVLPPYPGPQTLGIEIPNGDPSDHLAIASD